MLWRGSGRPWCLQLVVLVLFWLWNGCSISDGGANNPTVCSCSTKLKGCVECITWTDTNTTDQ